MANKNYWEHSEESISQASREMRIGFELLNKTPNNLLTFFGSAQIKESDPHYQLCEETAFEFGKRGYAIMTGGGPGIMRAANTGAKRAEAISIGIRGNLIQEQFVSEDIYTDLIDVEFMFLRRFFMYVKSKAWIFYPGGIGTLDELFECMQLRYTGIRNQKPIICVDEGYWHGLFEWMENNAYKKNFLMHGKEDLRLVEFANTKEEILNLVGRI